MGSGKQSDLAVLLRLFRQARPYWRQVAALFALSLLATPLALLQPLPLKVAVDSVIGSEPLPPFLDAMLPTAMDDRLLVVAVALAVGIALFGRIQTLGATVLRTSTGERMVLAFRALLFRSAQRLTLTHHDRKGTTDSTYRILYDAPAIQHIVVDGLPPFVTSVVTLGAMIAVTASISGRLALVALLVSPVLAFLSWFYRSRLRDQWREVSKLEHDAFSIAQESFGALRVVKAFGQEFQEEGRFVDRSREGVRAKIRVQTASGLHSVFVGLTIALGTGAVLFIGVTDVLAGTLTLGSLLLVMSYVAQLYQPLQSLGGRVTTLQRSLTMAERAFALLDQVPEVQEAEHPRAIARAGGSLRFEDLSFEYEPGRPILSNVSFEIPAGARVGIEGETGAGKSTLLNLVARFVDPTSGGILLDGVDLREYGLDDLRSQYSIVMQDTILFSTSIRDNIAFARPEASFEEIRSAARAANADGFIAALPEGYDTLVGERGMRLSGGERQRIGLARAFLKDAPILLLDEPTSAVDTGTEELIIEALSRLMAGKTTLMVAHRLSTLEGCDVRLRVEGDTVFRVTPRRPSAAGMGA